MRWLRALVRLGVFREKEAKVVEDMLDVLRYEHEGRLHMSELKRFKERIARKWNITPRTVHNYVRKLRRLGVLGVETTASGDYLIISGELGSRFWQIYKDYRNWLKKSE